MKLENLEEANQLRLKRERYLKVLELQAKNETVILNFNKEKPLDINSQVEVINTDNIYVLILEQIEIIELRLKKLGVELL